MTNGKIQVGLIHSRIRTDEKLLLGEFRKREDVELHVIDVRSQVFPINEPGKLTTDADETIESSNLDVVIERCVSHDQALHTLNIFEGYGIPTVNTYGVAEICGNKAYTSVALARAGVPTPTVKIAYSPETAIEAIEEFGYPAVMKPVTGSWGRLISRVNDRYSAETIIEHKKILGSHHHSTFYIQEYLKKPNDSDIRAFVVGDKTIAAIYRTSEHWITNTAKGGKATNCEVTDELNDICLKAAEVVGGGVLGIDILETPETEFTVLEVNYTVEFKNSVDTTGVDIPKNIVDYVLEQAG